MIGCLSRIFGVGTSEEDDKAEDARIARLKQRKIERIGSMMVQAEQEQHRRGWTTGKPNKGLTRLRRESMGTVATVITMLQQKAKASSDKHVQTSVKAASEECVWSTSACCTTLWVAVVF